MISNYASYKTSEMVFMNASKSEVPSAPGKPAIRTFRIPIRTRNPDNSIGNLVFAPEQLFTFGVSENKDDKTQSVNGFTLPLTLFGKDGPTENQHKFVETVKEIIECCKQHLLKDDIRKSIMKPQLKYDALEKMDKILYYKLDEETGLPVEGRGPSMYPKLYTRKDDFGGILITTEFFDKTGRNLDPTNLIAKYGYTTPAIVFDSIFIGAVISIQLRVMEAQIDLINSTGKRLLPRPRADDTTHTGVTLEQQPSLCRRPSIENMYPSDDKQEQQITTNQPEEQIVDDDQEIEAQVSAPPRAAPKKVVRSTRK
jgi:hypothetical protein